MEYLGIQFLEPVFLIFFIIPAVMLGLWLWRLVIRRGQVAKYLKDRTVPIKEKHRFLGQLSVWGFIILAILLLVIAMAGPAKILSVKDDTSVDLVIIQDGSASTRVRDLKPDRWQRSMMFLRTLTETLRWKGDRLALTIFAHSASPYIRLTNDPNVVLFFIDHLKAEPPLDLDDAKTWDTNIADGVYWGVRLLSKDLELYGTSKNPQAFILISDGQAWSGTMEEIFKIVKNVAPVYVVGAGTTVGGIIPEPSDKPRYYQDVDENGDPVFIQFTPEKFPPVHASIDRFSLRKIASTTGGEYFELGTATDGQIASRIISLVQRRRISLNKTSQFEELYWYFILGAGVFVALGTFSLYK